MNNLSQYVLEKLVINKDSINNSTEDSDYQYAIILPRDESYTYYYNRWWK